MRAEELQRRWEPGLAELSGSMGRWRQEHPRATLSEIEAALDERMGATRAQMLEEAVLASEAATFAGKGKRERPGCPACGQALVSRGEAERTLTTTGGRDIRIRRSYGACPSCGLELFPPR